jgi:hypothetical protein
LVTKPDYENDYTFFSKINLIFTLTAKIHNFARQKPLFKYIITTSDKVLRLLVKLITFFGAKHQYQLGFWRLWNAAHPGTAVEKWPLSHAAGEFGAAHVN